MDTHLLFPCSQKLDSILPQILVANGFPTDLSACGILCVPLLLISKGHWSHSEVVSGLTALTSDWQHLSEAKLLSVGVRKASLFFPLYHRDTDSRNTYESLFLTARSSYKSPAELSSEWLWIREESVTVHQGLNWGFPAQQDAGPQGHRATESQCHKATGRDALFTMWFLSASGILQDIRKSLFLSIGRNIKS